MIAAASISKDQAPVDLNNILRQMVFYAQSLISLYLCIICLSPLELSWQILPVHWQWTTHYVIFLHSLQTEPRWYDSEIYGI